MRINRTSILAIATLVILIMLAVAVSYLTYELRNTKSDLEHANGLLAEATKRNSEQGDELERVESDFQDCAKVAITMGNVGTELRDIVIEFEESTDETLNWLMENAYFYGDSRATAGYMVRRHYDRVDELAERFGEVIGYLE